MEQKIVTQEEHNPIIWEWREHENQKPIEMTVALPALNAEKIIWLALESLKNQTDITFAWELICLEEEGKSREIVRSYVGKLPGCVRIVHRNINPNEGRYKKLKRFTLLEKWIGIAKMADDNSKIYVKHAADDYSPPRRLYIHYEHFKNPKCYYSTQPKGYFYNILQKRYMLYNGTKEDSKRKYVKNHLNMALRTEIMKQIPVTQIKSGIDGYIFEHLLKIIKIDPVQNKIVFVDDEIDPTNWKKGLFTDGYNIISKSRALRGYTVKIHPSIFPLKGKPSDLDIPSYVFDKLNNL